MERLQFSTVGNFNLVKTLGTSKSSRVKLGVDRDTGQEYAIKILRQKSPVVATAKNEFEILTQLNHPNIVKILSYEENADYVHKDRTVEKVTYLVLELAVGGELFSYIAHTRGFSEALARFYFRQLIDSLEYIHLKGFAHRDLKPENLLFDQNFNLKLADFGFSIILAGRDGSGKLKTILDNADPYLAPEIRENLQYSGIAVDLFAAAVTLFAVVAGDFPFRKAEPSDDFYKLIWSNRHDFFWSAHNKHKGDFCTPEFKSLMNAMLAYDPGQRLSIAEIRCSAWYKGPQPSQEEVIKELEIRRRVTETALQKAKLKSKSMSSTINNASGTTTNTTTLIGGEGLVKRNSVGDNLASSVQGLLIFKGVRASKVRSVSGDLELEQLYPDLTKKRREEPYVDTKFKCHGEIFVEMDPMNAMHQAVFWLQDFSNHTFNPELYRFTCDQLCNDGDDKLCLSVRVKKVDETISCIEIKRTEGPNLIYLDIVNRLKQASLFSEATEENAAAPANPESHC